MTNPIRTKAVVLAVGLGCLTLGILFASTLDWTPETIAQNGQTAPAAPAALVETSNAFIAIAREVTPAVVYVTGQRRVELAQDMDLGPFEDFFEFQPQQQRNGRPQYRPSGGSGVIVRGDGHILTNNHVVEGLEDIQVVLNDRRQFDAEVVGRDPSTDVAVLKIDADDLPVARLAPDQSVQVGEWVLALGNPFGLEFTMTAGIVSAIGRGNLGIINRGDNPYAIEDFIQTDAAINPGNSGGPLVNIRGEIVGINTAIASRTGAYQGYGFAIPISIARHVMADLIESGEVRRAVLGVSIQTVTPLDAEALGLPRIAGVRIDGFSEMEDNPAREAGLRQQDVVLAVDGRAVSTSSELQQAIAFHDPGDEVTLTVWRGGRETEVEVELGERPDAGPALAASASVEAAPSATALGMEVQNVTAPVRQAIAQRYDVAPNTIPAGAFISEVDPLGPAGDANIPHPSIVTQVGDRPVRSIEDYRAAVADLPPGAVVYLRVWIPGVGEQFRAIRVPR